MAQHFTQPLPLPPLCRLTVFLSLFSSLAARFFWRLIDFCNFCLTAVPGTGWSGKGVGLVCRHLTHLPVGHKGWLIRPLVVWLHARHSCD